MADDPLAVARAPGDALTAVGVPGVASGTRRNVSAGNVYGVRTSS